VNPLRQLLREKERPYRVADKIGMPRNTVYRMLNKDGIPRSARIETLEKIARYFGYRIEINLVLEEVKDDHRTKNHNS